MALTEDELQEKRQKAADLQDKITEERDRRAALVAEKERAVVGDRLDAEIARLEQELENEKQITATQETNASPVLPTDAVVSPDAEVPAPPAPPAAQVSAPFLAPADKSNKSKES